MSLYHDDSDEKGDDDDDKREEIWKWKLCCGSVGSRKNENQYMCFHFQGKFSMSAT